MIAANIRYVQGDPTFEVLTPDEVKSHLRITNEDTSQDDLIATWIKVARSKAESYLRMALSNRTVTIYMDVFNLKWQ
jgi:hypothetical protein